MRIAFPTGGLQEALANQDQEIGTTFSAQNVRPIDVTEERTRGGQRAGTVKAYTTQIVGSNPILDIDGIVSTYITPV